MSPEFLPVKRKRQSNPHKTLNVRVPPKMKALLRQISRRKGLKVSVIVRKYIRDGLKGDGLVF